VKSFVEGLPDSQENQFSVASFNVLNQNYIRAGQFKTNPQFLEWEHRFQKQQDIFRKLNADVICLQEVRTQDFKSNYLEFFSSIGYEGMLQKGNHEIGTATFFKTHKFDLVYSESRSRALILGLNMKIPLESDNNNNSDADTIEESNMIESLSLEKEEEEEEESAATQKFWCVPVQICNVHFQSGWKNGATRMSQLKSLLKHAQAKLGISLRQQQQEEEAQQESQTILENHLTFICGDFNENQRGGAIKALQLGELEAGFVDEGGVETTKEAFTHPFKFTNVYTLVDNPHPTHKGYEITDTLDHIFAPCQLVTVVGVFSIRKGELEEMRETLLPNENYPSDHLPVAAMFCLRTKCFEKARKKAEVIT